MRNDIGRAHDADYVPIPLNLKSKQLQSVAVCAERDECEYVPKKDRMLKNQSMMNMAGGVRCLCERAEERERRGQQRAEHATKSAHRN